MSTAMVMVSSSIGYESNYCYLLALLTNVDTGLVDTLHPAMLQFPGLYKAVAGKDPDLPTYNEAMAGKDCELYEEVMKSEVQELEDHETWILVPRSSVPSGIKVLPSTWVLCANIHPLCPGGLCAC
jgi:hypothetical protein